MDVKYAYYNTSKGYKVTGGTAAHFLKADGSLDSKEYIDRYSGQTLDSTKTMGPQNTIYSGWDRSSVTNPQMGPFSLLNLALQGAYPLYGDEEFREGTNGIGVYNNYGNGTVTMTREAASNLPNRSGIQLRFNYNGNGATPGLGGFILGFNARSNAVFIQKFMAKLPVGYSFNNAENYMGDNASITWLTSKAGTGKWETYVRAVMCGTGTSFGNGGHVYVEGSNTALEFYLAFAEIYEVNSSVFSRIKEVFVTQSTFNTQLGNYATMAWVGQNYVDAPDGYSVIISGQDLNESKNTGFYRGSGLGHAPNNGWFFVIVEAHDSTWVKQTVTTYGSGNTANMTYQRVMSGGAWSAWQKVWTTQDFSQANINAWNNLTNGIIVNQEFTYNTGVGLMLVDDYYGGDSGMIDNHYERFVSGKQNDYYKYGSIYGTFDGLNFNFNTKLFGMGREANKNDKLTVEGSVKASQNFKSEDEKPNTIFIPNGNLATLNDEIVNDESEYAIRLDPHEYEIDPSGYLNVDDRNRLIHIIGEQVKMVVDFKKVYYKQQIVIYNFDQSGNMMAVKIQGKIIYNIEPGCFLRLYVTKSLRIIAEKQQPCDFIW
ncbi:hypothetical protein J3D55_003392 [Chryseobacterium ginsenosidimutans]|uniref:pyocin knob domain-containing protein n=1 Tax=Chryseobacterium ginsenosidimutans TaxID=687846 RepID=UPI00216A37F6|nr:pyocin knob domain-containing protein [Chryseobacterium ginsenosidimutans]MCS3870476.1 hypothetical protein [Chryseobacterium ginsenosidimutans]